MIGWNWIIYREFISFAEKADADIAIGNFTQFMEEEGNFLIHVGEMIISSVSILLEWFQHQYDGQYNLSQCFTVPWQAL